MRKYTDDEINGGEKDWDEFEDALSEIIAKSLKDITSS